MQIVTIGDPVLREKSATVHGVLDDTMALIQDMFRMMHAERGVGLAAVQVGRLMRVFITHVPDDVPRIFINPELTETSIEEGMFEEGCLSIPGTTADVKRPLGIRIQAWTEKEKPFVLNVDGLLARVIQHENDHLDGLLFVDRVDLKKTRKRVAGETGGKLQL